MSTYLKRRTVGYCCIPDIRDPLTLLDQAAMAQKAGFSAIWVSDHFHPWSHSGAHEYNTWVWMTAALGKVDGIPFCTAVTAPILRYNPAITAQAFATMEAIHGRRVMIGVGTGEAMNESPLGIPWPTMRERRKRLVEAIRIMRKLWTEEFVSFRGEYYALDNANLYMKANVPIVVAGFGPKMAKVAGEMGDGFLTVIKPVEYIKETLFPALRQGAEASGRTFEAVTKVIEIDMSYDEDYDKALKPLRFWAPTLLDEMYKHSISDPREIERMGRALTDEQLAEAFLVGTTPEHHIRKIEQAFDAGFDHVYVQSNSPDERKAIQMYEKEVLPYFQK